MWDFILGLVLWEIGKGFFENLVIRFFFFLSGVWQGNEGYLVFYFIIVDFVFGVFFQVLKK